MLDATITSSARPLREIDTCFTSRVPFTERAACSIPEIARMSAPARGLLFRYATMISLVTLAGCRGSARFAATTLGEFAGRNFWSLCWTAVPIPGRNAVTAMVAMIQAASIAYFHRTENLPRAEKNVLNLTVSYGYYDY
jgi:hypothetical protein